MSSPTLLGKLYNYVTGTKPPTEEEKDATLFGPIAILEIALRVLYPENSNIKYYIKNYQLIPQDIKDYTYGINLRGLVRPLVTGGKRNDFKILGKKVNQFINWYYLDNSDEQMKKDIGKLLTYTKEGLLLIAELPEYKADNAGELLEKYAGNIQDALEGVYPERLRRIVITDLGLKTKVLITKKDLHHIMTTFDRAIKGIKDKKQAQEEIRKEIERIRDLYIPIKTAANVETTDPERKRPSLIDDESSSESEETDEIPQGPENTAKTGEPEGDPKVEGTDQPKEPTPSVTPPEPKTEDPKPPSTEPVPVTSPTNSDAAPPRRKKSNRGVGK